MNMKTIVYTVIALFVAVTVCGCASAPEKMQEEVAGIKTRVETLETKVEGVEAKQAEAEKAAVEQTQSLEQMKGTNISIKSRAKGSERVREIQTCLKSAGYYTGNIDGVKGSMTKKAIKEFQKANGLEADGVVGKKTWEILSKYQGGGNQ